MCGTYETGWGVDQRLADAPNILPKIKHDPVDFPSGFLNG